MCSVCNYSNVLLLLFPWGGTSAAGGRGGDTAAGATSAGDTFAGATSTGQSSTGQSSTACRPTAGSRTWLTYIDVHV